MTISVAWVQRFSETEELVFVSDSRLRGGYQWDTAQKIFPLPGLNAVISFAGYSDLALPVIHQILSSCENYPKMASGSVDAAHVLQHILNILNGMRRDFKMIDHDLKKEMDENTEFLFGGYSFRQRAMILRIINYNKELEKFEVGRTYNWGTDKNHRKLICFAGDYYAEYFRRLAEIAWETDAFRMEPLQVLIQMLQTNTYPLIGGAPQMVKVYMHRNYLPFGFYWEHDGTIKVHLAGRPLLEYEKTFFPIVDPNRLDVFYPLKTVSNFAEHAINLRSTRSTKLGDVDILDDNLELTFDEAGGHQTLQRAKEEK
jgi:hypothetical protein